MAVRTEYRPVAEPGFLARAARAFAYVLLVVTCTVVAALGGHQVGVRSTPADPAAADRVRALRSAVRDAVATQAAKDRIKRRQALAQAMTWQRDKFDRELSAKVSAVRLAEAANAARAYRRGREAGRAALIAKVRERAAAEKAAKDDAGTTGAAATVADPTGKDDAAR